MRASSVRSQVAPRPKPPVSHVVGRRGPSRRRSRRSRELVQQCPQRPLRHARTWFQTAPFARADRSRTVSHAVPTVRSPSGPAPYRIQVPLSTISHAVPICRHARRPDSRRSPSRSAMPYPASVVYIVGGGVGYSGYRWSHVNRVVPPWRSDQIRSDRLGI